MDHGIDEKMFSRALSKMNKQQAEMAKRAMEGFNRSGNQEYLNQLMRLVEALDPGEAKSLASRVRR